MSGDFHVDDVRDIICNCLTDPGNIDIWRWIIVAIRDIRI